MSWPSFPIWGWRRAFFVASWPVGSDASGSSAAAAVPPLDISLNSFCQASRSAKRASRHLAADNVLGIYKVLPCIGLTDMILIWFSPTDEGLDHSIGLLHFPFVFWVRPPAVQKWWSLQTFSLLGVSLDFVFETSARPWAGFNFLVVAGNSCQSPPSNCRHNKNKAELHNRRSENGCCHVHVQPLLAIRVTKRHTVDIASLYQPYKTRFILPCRNTNLDLWYLYLLEELWMTLRFSLSLVQVDNCFSVSTPIGTPPWSRW